ncbi:MAG: TPR repeat protein [Paraglaciecola sp.]|jgi:TPR repeat protein
MKIFLISLLLFLGIPFSSIANEFGENNNRVSLTLFKGYAKFKMADYAAAQDIWLALAEEGVGEAFFNLAILEEDGLGTPKNLPKAISYYKSAANAGSRSAMYRLGLLYSNGVNKDLNHARHWMEKAAADGDTDAKEWLTHLSLRQEGRDEYEVGSFYWAEQARINGEYTLAREAFKQLSRQNHIRARTKLAWLWESGLGGPRDLPKAKQLFNLSAEQGDAEAQYALAIILQQGLVDEKNELQAIKWLKKAAKQGHAGARQALNLSEK